MVIIGVCDAGHAQIWLTTPATCQILALKLDNPTKIPQKSHILAHNHRRHRNSGGGTYGLGVLNRAGRRVMGGARPFRDAMLSQLDGLDGARTTGPGQTNVRRKSLARFMLQRHGMGIAYRDDVGVQDDVKPASRSWRWGSSS